MKRVVSHELLMPQGSHFSCFAKKSNQKKATPTFALIRDLKRKRRAVRNSLALKQRTASSTFSLQISGANTRGSRRTDSCSLRNEDYGNPDASIRATLATKNIRIYRHDDDANKLHR